MKQLLIASNNPGKISEILSIFSDTKFHLFTPADLNLPIDFDPEETGETFSENARIKAKAFAERTHLPAMADDSGLIVDALEGRPGVYSKRYGKDDFDRNTKIIQELAALKTSTRTARFMSAVCFYDPQSKKILETQGIIEGTIALAMHGTQGFGYDPIFIPSELPDGKTFAELGPEIKNTISHRKRALEALKQLL